VGLRWFVDQRQVDLERGPLCQQQRVSTRMRNNPLGSRKVFGFFRCCNTDFKRFRSNTGSVTNLEQQPSSLKYTNTEKRKKNINFHFTLKGETRKIK